MHKYKYWERNKDLNLINDHGNTDNIFGYFQSRILILVINH